jgi:hypothetical protein
MRLSLHILTAIAWAVIAQWPWGPYVLHALATLGVIHVAAPFWCHFAFARPFHRAFLFGPISLAAIDAGFVLYAWSTDLWSDLTIIAVIVLAAASALALLYSLLVMTLLDYARTKRQTPKN